MKSWNGSSTNHELDFFPNDFTDYFNYFSEQKKDVNMFTLGLWGNSLTASQQGKIFSCFPNHSSSLDQCRIC